MTCTDAEKSCPSDPRSIKNIKMIYGDPKIFDNTNREREEYSIKLKDFFKKHLESFDENTQKKMMSNPLRVLDSKDPKIKNIIDDIPIIENYLSSKTNDQFKIFQKP